MSGAPVRAGSATELTARGSAGVSVLEVRGATALERLAALAGGRLPGPGEARLARLTARSGDSQELLDEALLVGRDTGGERVVEAHLHGSRAVVAAVRAELVELVEPAAHGGSAPEGAMGLASRLRVFAAHAPTVLGARLALAQVEGPGGSLRDALHSIVHGAAEDASAGAAALLAAAEPCARLFVPARVVLTGPVNAGKSTLLNLLAGAEAALVSDVPGTTRDTVVASVTLGGWPFVVVDTAGERSAEASGAVERAGQSLAREVASTADVELRLRGIAGTTGPSPGSTVIELQSRGVEATGEGPDAWPADTIAALEFPDHALARVGEALRAALGLMDLAPLARALDAGAAPPPVLDPDTRRALVSLSASSPAESGAALDSLRALL